MDRSSTRLSRSETANSGQQSTENSAGTNRSSYYGGGPGVGGGNVVGGGELERSIYSERDRGYLSDMSSR